MLKFASILCASILAISIQAEDKVEKVDASKLPGKYIMTSGAKYGKDLPANALEKLGFTIEKEKMTLETPDGKFIFGYKVDASTTPAGIDLEILDGPVGKGSKSKGIIKVQGDSVTILYPSKPDAARPKEFKSAEADGSLMFVLKKAK